ncbi:MAG: right-handed parallel beta-helix repeat-containing protein [Candidatus Kapabacteria bacterium]|nr:right-handed parallel beta-helix repeat-containing protein [Candidatus Kapabacteria bacterium]
MKIILPILALLFSISQSYANVRKVGFTQQYKLPSQAAAAVSDGDTIEIDSAIYPKDACRWSKNNLLIRCSSGFAHLKSGGICYGGKAIWVISGNDCTVEGIEFSEASVVDQNGAGIRFEGTNLTVRRCFFHDNEDGILAGDNANSTILIEFSEFRKNGFGDGQSHNLYINHIKQLIFRFNYSHLAKVGHNLKTRALSNYIYCNRLMDEDSGTSSYLIDMPNGGKCYVAGNVMHQGLLTENKKLISYNFETPPNPEQKLYFINNTMVNDCQSGPFLSIKPGITTCIFKNNLIAGKGVPIDVPSDSSNNLIFLNPSNAGFVSINDYNYKLLKTSPAIDNGIDPGIVDSIKLLPIYQYKNPNDSTARIIYNKVDISAYEYQPEQPVIEFSRESSNKKYYYNKQTEELELTFNDKSMNYSDYSIYDYSGNIKLKGKLQVCTESAKSVSLRGLSGLLIVQIAGINNQSSFIIIK